MLPFSRSLNNIDSFGCSRESFFPFVRKYVPRTKKKILYNIYFRQRKEPIFAAKGEQFSLVLLNMSNYIKFCAAHFLHSSKVFRQIRNYLLWTLACLKLPEEERTGKIEKFIKYSPQWFLIKKNKIVIFEFKTSQWKIILQLVAQNVLRKRVYNISRWILCHPAQI